MKNLVVGLVVAVAIIGGGFTVFCVNDVNDKLNKNYIESPFEYHYQKIDVLDVKKMLGE